MKYETSLDLSFNNTMSIFIENIEPNSVILEFGPASGRLTKYLKENKNCTMYIVEIDEEAGKIASEYAADHIIGDILNYQWVDKFADIKFDYILFADVLEHLNSAVSVLMKSSSLLSENGKIFLSVPNIAHNSIIIDLLENKFNYTSTGLLDNTHIHFYTKESVEKLISDSGLYVNKSYATYSQVGTNEFNNTYSLMDDYISRFLKTRKLGEVYQYVYIIGNKSSVKTENNIVEYADYIYSQSFYDKGEGLESGIKSYLHGMQDKYIFTYENVKNLKKFRFDPLNEKCFVKILKVEGIIGDKSTLFSYESSNATYRKDDYFYFNHNDSQIYYVNENTCFDKIIVEVEYMYLNKIGVNCIKDLINQSKIQSDIIQQKDNYIGEVTEMKNQLEMKYNELNHFLSMQPMKWMYQLYCKIRSNRNMK